MRRAAAPGAGIKGRRAKQPYAIAMKDGAPFGLAGIWENWKEPASGEWLRTFAIITTDANELVAHIHDRMPVILAPADYARWLGDEPDPRDLMRSFPAELMRMWRISTRVGRVRELVIAHAQPGLHKVYDQHAYEQEKRDALEKLGGAAARHRQSAGTRCNDRPDEL